MTERPGRNIVAVFASSNAIFTGILTTTFVKLPVALSGGQRKLRTAGRRDLNYLSLEHLSRICVYADLRWVADSYVRELRLAIIC